MKKSLVDKFASFARNLRSKALFGALEKYCHGRVLDVGGWDFYLSVKGNPKIKFDKWVSLEVSEKTLFKIEDPRYEAVIGDGENMSFPEESFDTVVNIQVLEHTFEPIKMVKEISRVLKRGGYSILLFPQTGVMHHPPRHYYNFTKFWIRKAAGLAGLEIIELKPLGGRWATTASHMVHFFFQAFKSSSYSTSEDKRNVFFYILFPLMAVYAITSIIICLFLSLGDLTEEANNWLVVAKKL